MKKKDYRREKYIGNRMGGGTIKIEKNKNGARKNELREIDGGVLMYNIWGYGGPRAIGKCQ